MLIDDLVTKARKNRIGCLRLVQNTGSSCDRTTPTEGYHEVWIPLWACFLNNGVNYRKKNMPYYGNFTYMGKKTVRTDTSNGY